MNKLLEIKFSGWTATPRMPFIISGSKDGGSICMHTPSYSNLLGIIGCCLGRIVTSKEVKIGFRYSYDTVTKDMETRQRLENKGKIRKHPDGASPYLLEFHTAPRLTVWIDRIDWKTFFENPVGTPSLGRSQDILKMESVTEVEVEPVQKGSVSGCMLPFSAGLKAGGQLVQLAESYQENEEVGSGRIPTNSKVFIAIPYDNIVEIEFSDLFVTKEEKPTTFYLHQFDNG
jgi:CRISPR-associated protein Cas5t